MAKKKIVLCDTNILIELSKNNEAIALQLKNIGVAVPHLVAFLKPETYI